MKPTSQSYAHYLGIATQKGKKSLERTKVQLKRTKVQSDQKTTTKKLSGVIIQTILQTWPPQPKESQ
jgi:hypothetical protein